MNSAWEKYVLDSLKDFELCSFSVTKIDSDNCFEGLKEHKNFPPNWKLMKKYGFCVVPKKDEVFILSKY